MSEEIKNVSDEKKRKLDEGAGDHSSGKNVIPFDNFKKIKVLNENSQRKMICVHGKFAHDSFDAVVILEKTAFNEDDVATILSADTTGKNTLQNDIYGTYELYPPVKSNGIKSTLIYPATEKHIAKYSEHDIVLVEETAEDYKSITLPHLQEAKFSLQWVYNILEKKSEADRIVYEDPDENLGFVLLPDMKWNRKQIEDLYLVAIVHQKELRSLRDLNASHLDLLKNIQKKGEEAILEKFNLRRSQLRTYLHYQPSYYHLHVHFTHLKYDAPGSGVERAHLLTDVINNIEIASDYYQRKTISFLLKENDSLYEKFKDAGKI